MSKSKKEFKELKKRVISIVSENEENAAYLVEQINKIKDDDRPYSKLLELFVHIPFEEKDAKEHWNNILENHSFLQNAISERSVGFRVAMFDYFLNLNHLIDNPILVEIHIFREVQQLAMIDPLTRLFNRTYMEIAMKNELKRSIRYDKDFSVLIVDLDDFKFINDQKGHLFGDDVLREFSKLLKSSCRSEDTICRYGGEEFLIVLPETSGNGAQAFAERLREVVCKKRIFEENKITFSGGIATYPYDGDAINDLIKNADKALYAAKYSGKDCIHRSDPGDARRFERYENTWKLLYKPIDTVFKQDNLETVYTQDISLGGLKFDSNDRFDIGAKMLFEIELPDKENIVIFGKIAWNLEQGDKFVYGVQFYDLNKGQVDKLKRLLGEPYFGAE